MSAYGVQFERTKQFYQDANMSGWTTTLFPSSIGYVKPLDSGGGDTTFHHALGLAIVVPDFDRHQDSLGVTSLSAALRGQEQLLEETIWVMPAWGGCLGQKLCFGAALAATYHNSNGFYAFYFNQPNGVGSTFVLQQDWWAIGAGLQGGLQWQASNRVRVGITLRSPIRTITGGGSLLNIDSGIDPAAGARRVFDDGLWTDYRLPLFVRVGAEVNGTRYRIAADVQMSTAQDSYASVLGSGGADYLQPRALDGSPVGEPLQIGQISRRTRIINASLGTQVAISKKFSFLAGAFTDFSGTPDDQIDELHAHVNRLGATAGVSRKTARSTTYLTVVATGGLGHSFSLTGSNPSFESEATYLFIGGSTDLEDQDDQIAERRPDRIPLYRRWWFWTAIGAAVASGIVAVVVADSRSTGVPPSDLGSQRIGP